jgi:hypothetical protein
LTSMFISNGPGRAMPLINASTHEEGDNKTR